MIVECPECGTKNQTGKPIQPDKRYRCGKCGAVITFQQITANQDTLTEAPKEKPLPEKPRTIATIPKAAKRVLWKKGNILTNGKGISRRFLVIIAILIVVVIIVYFYLNYS